VSFQKVKPFRSEAYLKFVASHNCCNCNKIDATVIAHHEGKKGMGQKITDLRSVPLCFACHTTRHNVGKWPWEYVDPQEVMFELINEFMNGK